METFKGVTKENSNHDIALMIADILNNSNYTNFHNTKVNRNPDKVFEDNKTFWIDALSDNLHINQNIGFENVSISEWLPQSPGLFHTEIARWNRSEAEHYIVRDTKDNITGRFIGRNIKLLHENSNILSDDKYTIFNELYPEGKVSMIRGGIGCVRLEPKEIKNQEVFILGMTSTDTVHEGIPLICESSLYNEVIDSLKSSEKTLYSVVGKIVLMPKQISIINYKDFIPRYCIWADKITPIKSIKNSRLGISLSISFLNAYHNVLYSFVNIEEKDKSQLDWSIGWLKSYAMKYCETDSPSIVGDFDETVSYFSDSKVLLPIKEIAKGKYNQEQIKFFQRQFGMEFKIMSIENTEINNSGQIGVIGDDNQGDITLNQQNNLSQPIDFDKLLPALSQLITVLDAKPNKTTEERIAIGEVSQAEKAAQEKDESGVVKHLKSAGIWVFDTAKDIGVDIVTDLIKKQAGL